MASITEAMMRAAHDFESAAIEAGMDFAKCTYESPSWRGDSGCLSIFGVDDLNRTHLWKDGEDG